MSKKIVLATILYISITLNPGLLSAQYAPDSVWVCNECPENTGWNIQALDSLHQFIIDSTHLTGLVIVQHGKIVFSYGDISENSYIASCRKSVLSMLHGEHVTSGKIRLNATLQDLGIEDIGGLLPIEKRATVKDIIASRSGVFHPASYPGDYLELAPKRGSVKPGGYWLYSNWDFNVAGYIFEKQTRRSIYAELERILVKPLQMQDWNRSLQHYEGDNSRSLYPAYPMWFSTRDMARIGLLMLNRGQWNGRQVITEEWVRQMLTPLTAYTEVDKHIPDFRDTDFHFGYGYMWWLWQDTKDSRMVDGFSAMGAMGQGITVFPKVNLVIAFKTKADYERQTPYLTRLLLLTKLLQCLRPGSDAK